MSLVDRIGHMVAMVALAEVMVTDLVIRQPAMVAPMVQMEVVQDSLMLRQFLAADKELQQENLEILMEHFMPEAVVVVVAQSKSMVKDMAVPEAEEMVTLVVLDLLPDLLEQVEVVAVPQVLT